MRTNFFLRIQFRIKKSKLIKQTITITYRLCINGQCAGEQTDKHAFTVVSEKHLVLGGTPFSFRVCASAFIFVWIDATTKKNKKCIISLIFIYICMVHPVRGCEMTFVQSQQEKLARSSSLQPLTVFLQHIHVHVNSCNNHKRR